MSGTREYRAWAGAKDRCFNPESNVFEYYGGRGITMCEQWASSFKAFYADMGPRPDGPFSLDRIDLNGNYEPGNCRWADLETQMGNRRNGEEMGRTHCRHGHEFIEENTYRRPGRPGWRECRKCRNEAVRRSNEKRMARPIV
jgi:hypothetical protein